MAIKNFIRSALALVFILLGVIASYAQCSNIGFSQNNFNNWNAYNGDATVNDIIAQTGGLDAGGNVNTSNHYMYAGGGFDPFVPVLSLTSPLGGSFARVGNLQNGAKGAGIEYTMNVSLANAYLTLWYAVVLEDPDGGHNLYERPYFQIKLLDAGGTEVDCFTYFVAGQPGIEGFQKEGVYFWRDWTSHSIVLKDYIGQTVTLQVEASDCQLSGHLGYGYIDAMCQPLELIASSPYICAGVNSTLTAPADMATYEWRFGGSVISTDRIVTVTEAGTYTCEMTPPSTSGVVCPFELDIDLELKPTPESDFETTPIPNCLGVPTNFANTSTIDAPSSITVNLWNFGDGNTSTQKDPVHTYAAAGIYNVQLITESIDGCRDTVVLPVEIVDPLPPTLDGPTVLCQTDEPVLLDATPNPGGTFTGGGISASGEFDPDRTIAGASDIFTITYTEDVCGKFVTHDIEVLRADIPEITEIGPFCDDEPSLTVLVDKTDGYWEGPGIIDGLNGVFDPGSANVGDNEIFYRLNGACTLDDSIIVLVNHRPEIEITHPGVFCPSDFPVNIVVNDYSGTWSGPGVTPNGFFDPALANLGDNKLVYFIDGDCPNKDSIIVTVTGTPSAYFDLVDTICSSETDRIDLVPDDDGGKWSGPGMINPNIGKFDPRLANIGDNVITYTISGQCTDEHTEVIHIIKQPDATINTVPTLCPNDGVYQITTAETGGTWSGPHVSATGLFDPVASGPGSFVLTYLFSGRCPDVDYVTVDVTGIVPADFANPGPVCEIDAAFLLVADNPGGTWSGNGIIDPATGLFDPAVSGAGSHTISYTSPTSCGETKTQDIQVNAQPNPILTPLGPLCFDGAIETLQATEVGVWAVDGTDLPDDQFNPAAYAPGMHTVSLTVVNGVCSATSTMQVEIAQPLNINLDNLQNVSCFSYCDGLANVTVTGGPVGGTYQYNWVDGAGSPVASNANVSGLCNDSYILTVTDGANCTASLPITITQPAQIIPNVTPVDAYCGQANGEASAAPTGGDGVYTFTWKEQGQAAVFASGNPFTAFPANNYVSIVTDSKGCTGSEPFEIKDLPGPTIDIVEMKQPSCNGGSDGMLRADIAGSNGIPIISWNDGEHFGLVYPGLKSGNYKVAILDAEGCTAVDTDVLPEPSSVTISGPLNYTICDGQSVTVNAVGAGGVPYTTSPNYHYAWSTAGGTYIDSTWTTSDGEILTVTATDANGCVSPPLTIDVFEYPPLALVVSNDTAVCPDADLPLFAIPSGGNGSYTLTWDNGNVGQYINSNTSGKSNEVYQEHVVLTDGCSTPTDEYINVTIFEKPKPLIDGDNLMGCEVLTATLRSITTNAAQFSWTISDGYSTDNTPQFTRDFDAGSYDVYFEVITNDGCYGDTTYYGYIQSYAKPVADFRYQPAPADIFSDHIQMLNKSYSNIAQSNWEFYNFVGDSIAESNLTNPYFKIPDEPGVLSARLAVTTFNGCVDTVIKPIIIEDRYTLYVPNTFTPDDDGYNEIFIPQMFNIREDGYELTIWNRWGELLFETTSQKIGWDGTYQGEVVKEDTYVWKIKYLDLTGSEKIKYGHINLLR